MAGSEKRVGMVGLAAAVAAVVAASGGGGLTAASPDDKRITMTAAGALRLGMTIAEARNALSAYRLAESNDGDGVPILEASEGGTWRISVYGDDDEPPLDDTAKVDMIRLGDPAFATTEGVRVGTLLSEAEKRYGKLMDITVSEMESREFATFERLPEGLLFQVHSPSQGTAGIYPAGGAGMGARTTRYAANAAILNIWIIGPDVVE